MQVELRHVQVFDPCVKNNCFLSVSCEGKKKQINVRYQGKIFVF